MARNLFALLVGINQYDQDSVPELEGCVNDVNAIKEYLKGRVDPANISFTSEADNVVGWLRKGLDGYFLDPEGFFLCPLR